MSATRCESCTMGIETGPYCHHCVDASGALRPFAETFERFRQWMRREEPALGADEVDARVRAFMGKAPAWRDHPDLRRSGS